MHYLNKSLLKQIIINLKTTIMKKVILSAAMFMFVCGSLVANAQDPVKPEQPCTEQAEPAKEEAQAEEAQTEEATTEAPAEEAPAQTEEVSE